MLPIAGTLIITNTGPGALAGPIQVSLNTNNNPQFTLTSSPNPCSAVSSLAPGANCTTPVVFKGCYTGSPPTATINILAPNAANGTQTVPVGLAPEEGQCTPSISLSPSSVNFVPCPPGGTGDCRLPPVPVVITVTNDGSGVLQVGSLSVQGGNPGGPPASDYFTTTETSACAEIAAGQSCTISVSFNHPQYDPFSGTLVIDSNAIEGPQSVPLNWPRTPSLG